jgi:hypothetical protein
MGVGMVVWYNITRPGMAASLRAAGAEATRWPGGSIADVYHWQTNSLSQGSCNWGDVKPDSTFDNFMRDIAQPANLDVAVEVNYGTNAVCTGGADPSEAAAWVAYANTTQGYNIGWWTVGNEQYVRHGSHARDLHSQPHDPTQYAQIVTADYYSQMKAASSTPINVCVDADPDAKGWDSVVFAQASYDCVELHYYPQGPKVNDDFLIHQAAPGITTFINQTKAQLQAAGHPGAPIYLGEIGSNDGVPGKQTVSITQALYAGQVIGEMMNAGIRRATWHLGYGSCDGENRGGDFSKTLYGWQDFGGAAIFSQGPHANCAGENVPFETPFPTADAYQVASHFVRNGEHMLGVTVAGSPDVRAYASTYAGGYALMLFNLNQATSANVPVTIAGKSSGSGGTLWTYDKDLYDASKNNVWLAPTSAGLPPWTGNFTVALPPWSMVVVQTD